MALNDIHLSPAQVTEWYRRHLVAGEDNTPPPAPLPPAAKTAAVKPPEALQYLGKNQKKITILVNYPGEAYLPDAELNFLTSILQACKLHLGDVAIVNHAHHPLPRPALLEQLQSQYLLAFGVTPPEPALASLPPFTPLPQNGCAIMLSPALEQFNSNSAESKQLKGKLWACLKQLFNV